MTRGSALLTRAIFTALHQVSLEAEELNERTNDVSYLVLQVKIMNIERNKIAAYGLASVIKYRVSRHLSDLKL